MDARILSATKWQVGLFAVFLDLLALACAPQPSPTAQVSASPRPQLTVFDSVVRVGDPIILVIDLETGRVQYQDTADVSAMADEFWQEVAARAPGGRLRTETELFRLIQKSIGDLTAEQSRLRYEVERLEIRKDDLEAIFRMLDPDFAGLITAADETAMNWAR